MNTSLISEDYRISQIEVSDERCDGVYISDQNIAYLGHVHEIYTGISIIKYVEPIVGSNGLYHEAPDNWRDLVIERLS